MGSLDIANLAIVVRVAGHTCDFLDWHDREQLVLLVIDHDHVTIRKGREVQGLVGFHREQGFPVVSVVHNRLGPRLNLLELQTLPEHVAEPQLRTTNVQWVGRSHFPQPLRESVQVAEGQAVFAVHFPEVTPTGRIECGHLVSKGLFKHRHFGFLLTDELGQDFC